MAQLSLMARLGMDGSGFFRTAKQAEGEVKKLSREFNGNLKGSIAGAFGVLAISSYIRKIVEFSSHIQDLSDRTGVSTDALQEWGFAAKQNGADIDDVVGFFEKLGQARQKALGNNQESIASFKKLGITLDDLKKKRLQDVALGIGRTVRDGDPQNLASALRDVGGRGATKLITTFKADVEALAKAARDAGAVVENDTLAQLDDLGDSFDTLVMQLRGPVGEALISTISSLNMLTTGVRAISAYFGQAAAKSPTRAGQAMNVLEAASPIQILLKSLFPKMTKTSAGMDVHEDQFSAFKQTFADAAELELKNKAARKSKRDLLKSLMENPTATESGGGGSHMLSINSRQQVGAYIGGANPMLQVAQRSEAHLKKLLDVTIKNSKIQDYKSTDNIYTV